ncbi:hypothetical protein FWG86_02640 [Candidatus Saccharibacteria bacterium]|nr:hypothetical protein [Candidatus Saccharibacteria bacterium]
MTESNKVNRILGVSGWSRDRLAGVLGTNGRTLRRWAKGSKVRSEVMAGRIDWVYGELVEPLECEILRRAAVVEKEMLKRRLAGLPKGEVCG